MAILISMFLAGVTLLAVVQAVTITLYRYTGCDETGVILTCPDIGEQQCCYVPDTAFVSAKFSGLPLPAAQGIVFVDYILYGCNGRAVDAGSGEDLCLDTAGSGAQWLNPIQQTGACTATSDPLVATCKLGNGEQLSCDYGSCLDDSGGTLGSCDYNSGADIGAQVNCPSASRKKLGGRANRLGGQVM